MDQTPCEEDGCNLTASYVGGTSTGVGDTSTGQMIQTSGRKHYMCPAGHSTWKPAS